MTVPSPDPAPGSEATPTAQAVVGLVVEDHPQIQDWLAACLIKTFPTMAVHRVSSLREARAWLSDFDAGNATDAGSGLPRGRLTLALVDLGLPDGSGIDLIRILAARQPPVTPIVTTIYDDDAHLFEAITAGAGGYLLKDVEEELLLSYLRRIDRGEPPLSPNIAHRILAHFQAGARQQPAGTTAQAKTAQAKTTMELSPRETEVLALLAKGLTVAETAGKLGLKPQTVAGYVKLIYQKLNISSRAQATREAMRLGLA